MLTPPRPTPADLFAGRPRTVLTARPAAVPDPEPVITQARFVLRYIAAVHSSGLDHQCRRVALVLARFADPTGVIPATARVSAGYLAPKAGLSHASTRFALRRLDREGWIHCTVPAQPEEPVRISLLIPPSP